MSLNCSFNIKTEDITNIIGKDTFKNLTQEECESTITQLMSSYGLTQEDLLDNKYKSDIIAAIKRGREEAIKAALANIETEMQHILKNAPRDSEGNLLAPNGKKSNLTERQYAQVRTKAFKDWFGDWENDSENASKVVDENGEPLVVYHGSKSILNIFDPSKSKSRQYLSQQIKPTNFFSSDKTVADFFALTENQSLASQISKSISIVLDAFAGENVDRDTLDDEIWTNAAHRTGKSKEFVKDFWENKVPREYKMHDEFGTTRMKDPDINKYKYNVFLNMKSPIILDAKGERADRFIEANKEVLNNNDEVIIININETVGKKDTATDYLVRNPNQIKSATDNVGTFSRTDDRIDYFETNNSEKVAESQEALDILKKEGITLDNSLIDKYLSEVKTNNPYHQIFKQIVGILNNNNIPINIVVNSNLSNIAARKQDGFKTATIEINPALLLDYLMTDNKDNIKENLMKILTHELVHAVTAEILNYHPSWAKIKNFNEAQTEFSNNVWNLYLQCKEQLKGTKWYGLTNAKEFIAVALTDRDFQIELSKIKLDKNENAFKRFINYLTDLFNKVFKAQGIDIKNSALEEIISISQEYFNSANKNLRGGIYDYTGTRDYYDNNESFTWDTFLRKEARKNTIKESVYSKQLIKVLQNLIDKIKDSNIKEAKAAQNLYEWTIKAQQTILDAIEKGERKDDDLLLDKVQEQLNNLAQKSPENLAENAIKAAKEMGKDWGSQAGALADILNNSTKGIKKNTTSVTKIISGGQTGVDTIGLQVAKELGIETGGKAPKGFLREKGIDNEDIASYGLEEITDEEQADYTKRTDKKDPYTGRTELNVRNSNGTVYFNVGSDTYGLIATRRSAKEWNKPFIENPTAEELRQWIKDNNIKTLNVAGNRGSKLSKNNKVAETIREALTGKITTTTEQETKKKSSKSLKETIESAQAKRPVFDSIEVGKIQKRLLSIYFPNVTERVAATDFITNYFSLILDNTVSDFKESLNTNEKDYRDSLGDEEYERVYKGLFRGTPAQQRIFALSLTLGDKALPLQIFDRIKNLIDSFIETEDIHELVYDWYLNEDNSIKLESFLGNEFSWEAAQNGWDTPKKIEENAILRVRALKSYFTNHFKDDRVFDALVKEAAFDIEFNEGIRLDTRGNIMETNQEEKDKEDDVESEAENPNKEGYMIKYKLLDPIDTISVKLKNKLAHLYKMNFNLNRKNDVEYVFNPLGFRVKLNPMIAYYTILNEFQSISSEDELNEMFEDAVTKYPWLQSLKDNVVFNPLVPQEFDLDFRKEFFRACKSFAPFAMVTDKGTIAYLNRDNQSSTFLDMVKTTYEGHNVLGEHSIFNEDGTRNSGNVDKLFKLLTKGPKGTKDDVNSHPLFLVKRILGNSKSSIYYLFTALQILRGEHPRYSGISLEKMLRNLGIETANMNLEALLPATFALELEADGSIAGTKESFEFTAEFIEEAEDNNMNPVDYFNSLFTPKMKRYLATILEKATVITRPVQGYQDGDDLVTKFQNAYLSIGNALTMANEAYSQTSFRFAGNNRFSYVAYDMITRMSNLLSKVKTVEAQERGTKYLIDNYGQYDFFRNQETGEWYNTWLQQWFEKDEHGEYTIRENFKILNMLGFGGNEEKNSFGKVTSDALIDNHILAFLNGNKDKYGNTYGYYRNALFSDTDASVLIKHIRYVGDDYKKVIINNLAKVLRQEFERIISLLKSNEEEDTVQIEFFNKNGTKFNFFPALNSRRVELLKKYVELSKLSSAEFKEQSNILLTSLITDIIEGEKDPVTGLRSGGKLQEFLNSIDEIRRKTLYTKIKKVNAAKEKEETKGEEEDEEGSSKIDFGENEETKESKEESSEEKNRELDEILTNFFYNDYFAQSQIIQIFGGDLAYYKNFRDFIKRNKQAYAAGDRLYGMLMDEQGNNIEPLMETSIYLKDKIEVSNSYESIKHMLNSAVGVSKLSKEMILGALSGYRNITATDGQSFRTPKAIKKILQAMGGKWTDDMEEAFNRMTIQRKFDSNDFFTIWNNIKPFLYSHETVQVGDRKEKVITQHKNSEYMMTAMYDMIGMALSKSPQLRALQEFMEDNDIDVAHFNSVVKEGFFSGVNINYDKKKFEAKKGNNNYIEVAGHQIKANTYENFIENLANALDNEEITQSDYNNIIKEIDFDKSEKGVDDCYNQLCDAIFMKDENGEDVLDKKGNYMIDPIKVHKFPLSDYMVVQPSGDHLTEDDLMAIFGSQLRNIIPADLPENFSITINLGGKKKTLNREEYIKLYNTLIVDQLLDSFARVNDEFSSVEKLQSALLAKIHGNLKYGSDVEEALQLETDEYGNKRFKIPFNNPNLNNKIEELLLSTFKNAIQKQKINGGNIILVSNFGLSDDLQIHYKKDEDGNESIDYIDCYMPAYKRSLIQDFLVEKEYGDTGEKYWEIDYDKIKDNEDLLEMIGYRIPTENKYSIFKMRIKGFLPISAGTAIMLPSDIVNMSGTDFK